MIHSAFLAALIIWPNLDDPNTTALLRTFEGEQATEECWQYLNDSPHSGYCVGQWTVQRPMARPDDLMEGR